MNEHDDMQIKRDLDALPRTIEPPLDLWPGVRGRLTRRGTEGRRDAGTETTRPTVPLSHRPAWRVAALLTLLALSAGGLALARRGAATWQVSAANDAHRILRPGDSLVALAPTSITVGRIGTVEVQPGTRMRLVSASVTRQQVQLASGTIHARISAPPRVFVVETPSGIAVDLGCEYTLSVGPLETRLAVTAGWVEFNTRDERSLVPAGMSATSGMRFAGLGLPVRDDASAALAAAVRAFDNGRPDSALAAVLREADRRDAVTLWHLIDRTSGESRERVVTRLAGLVPLPDGVTRAAILRREPHAMELYWTALPGTLPIIPSWQQSLWKLWLRIAG